MLSITRRLFWPFHSCPYILLKSFAFSLEVSSRSLQLEDEESMSSSCDGSHKLGNYLHGIKLPHSSPYDKDCLEKFNIELVDQDIWNVSFSLAHSWYGMDSKPEKNFYLDEDTKDGEICNGDDMVLESYDFDVIDELRIQKKLFYKLDKESKEYDECNFSFHKKKSLKKSSGKQNEIVKECKKSIQTEKSDSKPLPVGPMTLKKNYKYQLANPINSEASPKKITMEGKKKRTPTFNQLTDPYHLPFCLDIFITKGSVRACVIHRVSSKVVAVAHSISKDMKFDLTSRRDATTCVVVGKILAQRAIEDDIHNVVYTPRKGDKIEGKLQIVLQSIIDNGVDVKVKLKQNITIKGGLTAISSRFPQATLEANLSYNQQIC
ncbi:hypothetical protein HPP92_025678 [Vanilla planifolia]|uniref:Uncharacterized protein n=1 Tax=Vanilla planifolia TaxID=51239 RepID=A0A835U982_VANPL|nr:hypothetical protein HPP92_025952 [Vanilla planifolia]KAG0454374.1 hypothetical protein HPP92_025678 [Vanilla planifolia]